MNDVSDWDRLKIGMRGLRVRRMHTLTVHRDQTVGEHTAGVLYILHLLGWDHDVNVMRAALFHDMAEAVLGDMPHTAKRRFTELGIEYESAETAIQDRYGWKPLVELDEEQKKRIKIADMLEFAFQMRDEYLMGNKHPSVLSAIEVAMNALNKVSKSMGSWKLDKLIGELMADFELWERGGKE